MALIYVPLRLKPELLHELDAIAKKRGKPRAHIMREGLQFFAERNTILSEMEYRRLMADEFIYLALDVIIREKHNGAYQGILDEAAERAKALCA
ncbi:MAG: hypothetical protein C0429_13260 [Sphingopyxis sp.]|nr:hypothetical protein [Sphingopyxis sp.]